MFIFGSWCRGEAPNNAVSLPDQRECRRASAAGACTRLISASLGSRGRRAASVFPDLLALAREVNEEPRLLKGVSSGVIPALEAEHDRNSEGKLRQKEEWGGGEGVGGGGGRGGGGQGAAAKTNRAIWQRAGRNHEEQGRTGPHRVRAATAVWLQQRSQPPQGGQHHESRTAESKPPQLQWRVFQLVGGRTATKGAGG